MSSIKIIASGIYLPNNCIENSYLNQKFNLNNDWIYKRTGILKRYWEEEKSMTEMAIKSVENLLENNKINVQDIGIIITASTKYEDTMPGISFNIQKMLNIKNCICIDILAGCSGYINAIDIVKKYLDTDEIKYGLIIGIEKLSKYINKDDINTAILLGDGAGATLIKKSENKLYSKNIESIGQEGDILTCKENEKIYMDGKKIYKFATVKVAQNIINLLEKEKLDILDIKYIIPHQSNLRIISNISERIGAKREQMYINIGNIGNTFNASIPIALDEILKKKLLKEKDKIILTGYGGGLNLGSIIIEI